MNKKSTWLFGFMILCLICFITDHIHPKLFISNVTVVIMQILADSLCTVLSKEKNRVARTSQRHLLKNNRDW